ncbi:MAG: hypothetical protein QXU99_01205 [Candidatus Bathyarchaeia archaeon]
MYSEEKILMQEAGVKAHASESPPTIGLKAGAFADVGTLILTNRRLVYVMKGGAARSAAWVLGGAFAALAVEKTVSKAEIDELMKYPGSYFIPIEDITGVKAARKMGQAYIRVDNCTPGLKPSYSFVFGSGWSKNEEWVNAINAARAMLNSLRNAPANALQAPLPPPPQDFVPPRCPMCGGPLSYIQQYQRWYCYRDQKYV